ncbi:MAG: hypothetical protein ACK5MY_11015 [Jhaorihella sp.]
MLTRLARLSAVWRVPVRARAAFCLSAVLAMPAAAQDTAFGDWSWSVTPFVWGTGLTGQVGAVPGVPPASVDMSFGDILSNLDMGAFATWSGNNGRFGISGDLQYTKLSASSRSLRPLWGQADVKTKLTVATLLGDYKISASPQHELWLSGGLRYWDVQTTIALTPGTRPGGFVSGSDSWVDPVIGLRGRHALGDKTFLSGWAYLGGFGVGSDEMADLFAGVGHDFSGRVSAMFGYRWLSVDRVDGGFVFDTVQQGPLAGVTFRF